VRRPPLDVTDQMPRALVRASCARAVFGQLSMGYAGDVLGRRNAMLLTQGLSALGAIGSALFTWGSAETILSRGMCMLSAPNHPLYGSTC